MSADREAAISWPRDKPFMGEMSADARAYVEGLLAELVAARERDGRLIAQMDECLDDDEAWTGERLVALIEDIRAALDATEEQA